MVYYIIVVIAIVLLSSIVLISILNKNNLLNIRTIVAISLSSITISLIVPFIFGFLIGTQAFSGLGIFTAFFIGFMGYVLLVFLFTILVSSFISETKAQEIWNVMVNGLFMKFINNFVKMTKGFLLNTKNKLDKNLEYLNPEAGQFMEECVSSEIIVDNTNSEININDISDIMNTNIILDFELNNLNENSELDNIGSNGQEEIIMNDGFVVNIDYFKGEDVNAFDIENNKEYMEEIAVEREIIISNTENDVNNLKDVETGGLKIDKVIGNIEEQTVSKANEDLSIDQYIDEAFRLKGLGDFEGAILYYMYALDKKPDKDVVFWIVLDTCVLYKELGQIELAKEILESYVSSYGDLMDVAVRAEIESNLINI